MTKGYDDSVKSWITSQKGEGYYAVDLDGTLAHYDEWRGELFIGEPITKMVDRVKKWLQEGKNVKIFTARLSNPDMHQRSQVIKAIEVWTEENIGVKLPISNVKDYNLIELWDDRAVGVVPNTGERADGLDDSATCGNPDCDFCGAEPTSTNEALGVKPEGK